MYQNFQCLMCGKKDFKTVDEMNQHVEECRLHYEHASLLYSVLRIREALDSLEEKIDGTHFSVPQRESK